MSHPDEQELVMYALGEPEDRETIEEHVAGCETCTRELAQIHRLMEATARVEVPEPDAGFEARIWARQRESLVGEGILAAGGTDERAEAPQTPADEGAQVIPFRRIGWRPLLLAGAIAASVTVAFLIGLYTPPPGTVVHQPGEEHGDRVLLIAVGQHAERARMVLVELANADPGDPEALAVQQARAGDLLADNRLYRQTATLEGRGDLADVLDEVERVLLETARTPGVMSAEDLQWLQERIRDRDLIFKVSVLESGSRPGNARPGPAA